MKTSVGVLINTVALVLIIQEMKASNDNLFNIVSILVVGFSYGVKASELFIRWQLRKLGVRL